MNLSIAGARGELGRVLAQHPSKLRGGPVHVNLSGQQANTLLHDGHAWKGFARMSATSPQHMQRRAVLDVPASPGMPQVVPPEIFHSSASQAAAMPSCSLG